MGKEMIRTKQRDEIMQKVIDFLEQEYDADIRFTGTGEIMMPAVDENGEEFYFKFKASIPRGKRSTNAEGKGTYIPYNGYEKADEYDYVLKDRANKVAIRQEKAEQKEREKERKRAARKVIKKLNDEGLQKLIHDPDTNDEIAV